MDDRTYTQHELWRRLHTLAWLIVECVDDHVGMPYMDGYVPPDHSAETRAQLLADYERVLKRLKVKAPARKMALAKYDRYLSGPFPRDKYPLMGSSNPSWEARREMLHDKGAKLALTLSDSTYRDLYDRESESGTAKKEPDA